MNKFLELSLKALILGVSSGVILFYAYGQGVSKASPPRIVVAEQPGSPLLILPTGVDSTNPLEPHYWLSITNKSDKQISAYAIQHRVSLGPGVPVTGTSFVHFPSEKSLLRPHESKQEDGGFGRSYQRAPVEIVIAVDFVEFSDGTRWGDDLGKSGERLDGQRAGGNAAITKYREILAKEGVDGLLASLADPSSIKPGRSIESSDWQDGFRTGVNIVIGRIRNANLKGGPEAVRREINKPFDSKSGRREP